MPAARFKTLLRYEPKIGEKKYFRILDSWQGFWYARKYLLNNLIGL